MTLQQLRYAVDIEKAGSITKSAANLFMSQPNLSTALKELEEEIGITVFVRDNNGVKVTDEGKEFLAHAKSILHQMDRMLFVFKSEKSKVATLNVACVRSSYVTKAMCDYYNQIPKDTSLQLKLMETTTANALELVAESKADVGRVIFHAHNFQQMNWYCNKKRLALELLWKVKAYILVSENSPLAKEKHITRSMLLACTRLVYIDTEEEIDPSGGEDRRIAVSERGTMMDILSGCPDTYIWTVSTHPDTLKRYGLVTMPYVDAPFIIEAIVYSKDRPKTQEMEWFLAQMKTTRYSEYFHIQEPFQIDEGGLI